MSRKLLVNNTIWLTINHVLNRGILMIASILIAKFMISKDFALYSYYQMTVVMISSYASLGLGLASSKFYAEYSVSEKKDNSNISNLSIICFYSAIFIAVIIFIIPLEIVIKTFDIPVYLISLTVMFLVLNIVPTGALMGLEKYKSLTFISFISGIILIFGVVLSIVTAKIFYSICFYLFSLMVQFFGCKFIINKISPVSFNIRINFGGIKSVLGFIGPMFIVSIVSAFTTWVLGSKILDVLGNEKFSAYAIGLQWFSLALFIPGMISRVILPMVIRDKINNVDNRSILKKSCFLAIAIAICICICIFLFSDKIINFYGASYTKYKLFFIGFLFVSVLYAPANTLGNALIAKIGSKIWLKITLLWVFILTGVFFTVLTELELNAIILSHGIASFFMLVSTYFICKKNRII